MTDRTTEIMAELELINHKLDRIIKSQVRKSKVRKVDFMYGLFLELKVPKENKED